MQAALSRLREFSLASDRSQSRQTSWPPEGQREKNRAKRTLRCSRSCFEPRLLHVGVEGEPHLHRLIIARQLDRILRKDAGRMGRQVLATEDQCSRLQD